MLTQALWRTEKWWSDILPVFSIWRRVVSSSSCASLRLRLSSIILFICSIFSCLYFSALNSICLTLGYRIFLKMLKNSIKLMDLFFSALSNFTFYWMSICASLPSIISDSSITISLKFSLMAWIYCALTLFTFWVVRLSKLSLSEPIFSSFSVLISLIRSKF